MNKTQKLIKIFIIIIFLIFSIIKSNIKNNKSQIIKKILLFKIFKKTKKNINALKYDNRLYFFEIFDIIIYYFMNKSFLFLILKSV